MGGTSIIKRALIRKRQARLKVREEKVILGGSHRQRTEGTSRGQKGKARLASAFSRKSDMGLTLGFSLLISHMV